MNISCAMAGRRLLLAVLASIFLEGTAAAAERDFSARPPRVEKAVARLLPRPTAAGNAIVEVVFARDEALPPQIPVYLEQGAVALRDDGLQGDRVAGDRTYSAIVQLDIDALKRDQERLRNLQRKYGELVMPVYQGRRLVSRLVLPSAFFRPFQPDVDIPLDWWGFPVGVQPDKSLVIRDPDVVEDPTRTYDPCSDAGTPMGKWTFGHLMTQLANSAYTGINPSDFALQWIQKFVANQTVNGFAVFAQPDVQDVIDAWPKIGMTAQLDLAKAPFKLLAIVNRVDLRSNLIYGGGNAGEARFVFGFRRCSPASISPRFTVIIEYGIRKTGCLALKNWAQQWVALGDLALGSAAYNAALEAITDQFSLADAASTKPNRSALNQLRTNRGPSDSMWQFREFRLVGKGAAISQLTHSTVKQTPDSDIMPPYANSFYPNPDALADYVNANEAAIMSDTHVVPLTFDGLHFRGGSSTRHGVVFEWDSPLIANREARHKFALQTCNGCHFTETGTDHPPQTFFHIAPAHLGAPATLSGFMTGIDVPDPIDGMPTRHFNELDRRATDLDALANNICLKALDPKLSLPLEFVH